MFTLSNALLHQWYLNFINSLLGLLILMILYIGVYLFWSKHVPSRKGRQRLRIRLFYVAAFIFVFLIARIWVEGFTHLVALLSLVSAALVVTNKEFVMNLMGWLIINWRELFSEGDCIQIQNYTGYVHDLGLLYFRLFEKSPDSSSRTSGRMIKIPNGLVLNNTLINYSKHSNFLEYVQSWLFTFDTPIEKAESLIRKAANSVVRSFYGKIEEYSLREIDRRNHVLSELLDFDVHVKIIVQTEKPTGFKVKLTYYAYPKDHDNIDQAILKAILRALSTHPDIHLLEAV